MGLSVRKRTWKIHWSGQVTGHHVGQRLQIARQVSCTRHPATSSLLAFLIAAKKRENYELRWDFHMAMGHSQGQTCQNPGTLMNPRILEITGKWRLYYSRIQYQGEKCKNPARSRSVSSPHGLTKANSAGAILTPNGTMRVLEKRSRQRSDWIRMDKVNF